MKLFVCQHNTGRSPAMEVLFRKLAQERNLSIEVTSAGIAEKDPSHASENLITVMREDYGIDISTHLSKPISKLNLQKFETIYCTGAEEKDALIAAGADFNKIFILNEENGGIPNPHGKGIDEYRECVQLIYKEIKEIVEKL